MMPILSPPATPVLIKTTNLASWRLSVFNDIMTVTGADADWWQSWHRFQCQILLLIRFFTFNFRYDLGSLPWVNRQLGHNLTSSKRGHPEVETWMHFVNNTSFRQVSVLRLPYQSPLNPAHFAHYRSSQSGMWRFRRTESVDRQFDHLLWITCPTLRLDTLEMITR